MQYTQPVNNLHLRDATAKDIEEIFRLKNLMYKSMGYTSVSDDTHGAAREVFAQGLKDGTFTARVIDNPDVAGHLIACGIGNIAQRMPVFWLPNGKTGYIQWLSVEEEWRHRGFARRILQSLIEWFTEKDVVRIELHSSMDAVAFYEQIGFEKQIDNPDMWFYVTPAVEPNA